MNSPLQRTLLHAGLTLLLCWSALESGGRYLFGQTLSQVICGGLLLLVVLTQLRTGLQIQNYPLLGVTAGWLLAILIACVFSVNRLASLEEFLRYLMYLSLPLLTALCVRSARTRLKMTWVILTTALLICLIGWFKPGELSHLTSTFNRTNDLAGYLLIVIPLALHLLLIAQTGRQRLILACLTGSLVFSLMLTQSRSSWAACCFSLVLLFVMHKDTVGTTNLKRWGLGLLGIALVSFVLNWSVLGPRLTSLLQLGILHENATAWRLELLQGAWRIFQDFPLTGSGPNTFGAILPAYQSQPGYFSINPHNYYLQLLAEMGLIGFLACVVYMWTLFKWILKTRNALMPGIVAGLSASLFHTGFDIDWSVSAIPILFFVTAGMGLSTPDTEPIESPALSDASRLLLQTLCALCGLTLVALPAMNQWSAQAFGEASIAWSQQQTSQARQALLKARQMAPWPSGRHHALQAEIELKSGHPDLALRFILRALELDRYNTTYMKTAAQALLQSGKTAQAEALFEKRIRLTPYRHPEYYRELGDLLWRHKKIQAAQKTYRQGINAFPVAVIPRYELYTPSHRYELFMLYQHAAHLARTLKSTTAENLENQAQELIKTGTTDLFVQEGLGTPVTAVKNYWLNLGKQQQKLSLTPERPIPPPPPELVFKSTELHFLEAKRDIFTAELVYLLPMHKPNETHWNPLILKDQLQGFPEGWKIVHREAIKLQPSQP